MKTLNLAVLLVMLGVFGPGQWGGAAQLDKGFVAKDARCPVCGMFVAKFPNWLTQLKLSNGHIETFDGVKDMMTYYFSPQSYGAAAGITVREVMVKEYYSQNWIDGRQAVYVLGSDVYGPMGHELIPFAGRPGAENFMKDHKGREVLLFSEITPQLVEALRKGHTMTGHGASHGK